mmetsp:Transcript_28533/g.89383  ORF Transcript_28533/g.89383 Transcript_28533/m.89383 type:complete len:316 (+) Transcript_28533:413-1360(+)
MLPAERGEAQHARGEHTLVDDPLLRSGQRDSQRRVEARSVRHRRVLPLPVTLLDRLLDARCEPRLRRGGGACGCVLWIGCIAAEYGDPVGVESDSRRAVLLRQREVQRGHLAPRQPVERVQRPARRPAKDRREAGRAELVLELQHQLCEVVDLVWGVQDDGVAEHADGGVDLRKGALQPRAQLPEARVRRRWRGRRELAQLARTRLGHEPGPLDRKAIHQARHLVRLEELRRLAHGEPAPVPTRARRVPLGVLSEHVRCARRVECLSCRRGPRRCARVQRTQRAALPDRVEKRWALQQRLLEREDRAVERRLWCE